MILPPHPFRYAAYSGGGRWSCTRSIIAVIGRISNALIDILHVQAFAYCQANAAIGPDMLKTDFAFFGTDVRPISYKGVKLQLI